MISVWSALSRFDLSSEPTVLCFTYFAFSKKKAEFMPSRVLLRGLTQTGYPKERIVQRILLVNIYYQQETSVVGRLKAECAALK
jgi:hypothetical protein